MRPIPEVSDVDIAFGGEVMKLLPNWAVIPEEFKRRDDSWEHRFVSDAFFRGVKNLKLEPREGVDPKKAMRVIKACLASFEPKHEHKEAGCAYLLHEWFTSATWETAKDRR